MNTKPGPLVDQIREALDATSTRSSSPRIQRPEEAEDPALRPTQPRAAQLLQHPRAQCSCSACPSHRTTNHILRASRSAGSRRSSSGCTQSCLPANQASSARRVLAEARAQAISDGRRRAKPLSVYFFDSATAEVWRPAPMSDCLTVTTRCTYTRTHVRFSNFKEVTRCRQQR